MFFESYDNYSHHSAWLILKLFSTTFSDIPNCENDDGCHDNATCTDDNGSYICICQDGFTGDGFNCTGLLYIA